MSVDIRKGPERLKVGSQNVAVVGTIFEALKLCLEELLS